MKGFQEIRRWMRYYQITQANLEVKFNRGHDYINKRFNGHKSFTMDEAYMLLDLLNLPQEQIYEYFPPLPAKQTKQVKRQKAG